VDSISISSSGSFDNTEAFLKRVTSGDIFVTLDRYGQIGVQALANATPKRTGLTSSSWSYEIMRDSTSYSIVWSNSNVVDGRPVAILLQYGHGTGTGGYVQGRDYINPALQPIFDQIEEEVRKAVFS
jgi:hypothetical protein